MLDYRVETFLTLCRERNYSKTAQILCITQPAVTQHIQYLERLYGTKLFEYANKKMLLTKQGEILEEVARGFSASNQKLYDIFERSKNVNKAVKCGATMLIGELILPGLFNQVLKYKPDLDIHLVIDNSENLIEMLKNKKCECILIDGKFNKDEFLYFPMGTKEIIAVSGEKREQITLEELKKDTLIIRETGCALRKKIDDYFKSNKIEFSDFKNIIEVNSVEIIKKMIKEKMGFSFMYRSMVQRELEEGVLFELPLDMNLISEFNFLILKNFWFKQYYIDLYDFLMESELIKELQ